MHTMHMIVLMMGNEFMIRAYSGTPSFFWKRIAEERLCSTVTVGRIFRDVMMMALYVLYVCSTFTSGTRELTKLAVG